MVKQLVILYSIIFLYNIIFIFSIGFCILYNSCIVYGYCTIYGSYTIHSTYMMYSIYISIINWVVQEKSRKCFNEEVENGVKLNPFIDEGTHVSMLVLSLDAQVQLFLLVHTSPKWNSIAYMPHLHHSNKVDLWKDDVHATGFHFRHFLK